MNKNKKKKIIIHCCIVLIISAILSIIQNVPIESIPFYIINIGFLYCIFLVIRYFVKDLINGKKNYVPPVESNTKEQGENILPPVSEKDMQRIHNLIVEKKKENYEFGEVLNNISVYVFPLESNTKLLSTAEVANEMVSVLHYCFEAKIRLNLMSEDFLSSVNYKKFMISFTDGFMFDDLEKFSNYSEDELKNLSESNYQAYFYAYILGLIDKFPENPEDCDEKELCSLITKFNSYGEMLDNCKMLNKENVLCIADYLVSESWYYGYKKDRNIPYDEKMKNYKSIQRFCSFYVLSFDFDSMMEKLKNVKE